MSTPNTVKVKRKVQIGIKLDPEIKERFLMLAKEEKLNMTSAVEHLIVEALSRGYIIKERHEALKEADM